MRESTFIVSTIILKRAIEINTPSSLLIEGNTITDSQGISEHFKNFFTSICQDLQKHFAPTKEHFSDHVKAPNKIPGPILEFKESVWYVQKGHPHMVTQADMILQNQLEFKH